MTCALLPGPAAVPHAAPATGESSGEVETDVVRGLLKAQFYQFSGPE